MSKFDEYSSSYRFIKMERRGGIMQMMLHTDGGPLQWNLDAQVEFVRAFTEVGADRENRIVILTGSGNEFSGPPSVCSVICRMPPRRSILMKR